MEMPLLAKKASKF